MYVLQRELFEEKLLLAQKATRILAMQEDDGKRIYSFPYVLLKGVYSLPFVLLQTERKRIYSFPYVLLSTKRKQGACWLKSFHQANC